jgi:phi13 family phage major tail protein
MASGQNPKIGLDMVYVAKMVEESDVLGGTPTWDASFPLPGAVLSKINPNGALITDWADNGPFFVTNSRGNLQLSLELTGISQTALAALLGNTVSNGLTSEDALAQSPWFGLMFRVWIGGLDSGGNKIFKYFSLPKGKFAIPEDGADTKKDSISPQHVTLSAEFARLEVNGLISIHGRSDESMTATAIAGWFTTPTWQLTQSLTAVTVGVITGSNSGKTITVPFAKSGETFSMVVPNVSDVSISVVSTGLLIAGTTTITASAAGIAPTLILANTNISAVSHLVSITAGVKDVNGVPVTPKTQLVTPA